jgi:predicted molibdopterin-dependent oxidoreductase YjgC
MLSGGDIDGRNPRLTGPMLRVGRTGPLRPVSWDHAIAFIVDRLVSTQRRAGADSVAFMGSGRLDVESSYAFTKLFKGVLRTNNQDADCRIVAPGALSPFEQVFGAEGTPACHDDVTHADVVLIVASDVAQDDPSLMAAIRRRRVQQPNSRIIVIDPAKTTTAQGADVHVGIHPGGELAFISLLARRIMLRGKADARYIDRHAEGFASWTQQLMALDERTAMRSLGIHPGRLDEVTQLLDGPVKLLSIFGQRCPLEPRATAWQSALLQLHVMMGQLGRPGCGPLALPVRSTGFGGRQAGSLPHLLPGCRRVTSQDDRHVMEQLWGVKPGAIRPEPGLGGLDVFRAAGDGAVKLLWLAGADAVMRLGDAQAVSRGMDRAEVVIAQDTSTPAELVSMIDVLLPSADWGETTGTTIDDQRLVRRSASRIDAPGQAKPDWWIPARVGQALGVWGFEYSSSEQVWDEFRTATAGAPCDLAGITNRRLLIGPARWPCPASSSTGLLRLYADGRFPTPSGKAHLAAIHDAGETPDITHARAHRAPIHPGVERKEPSDSTAPKS